MWAPPMTGDPVAETIPRKQFTEVPGAAHFAENRDHLILLRLE